MQPARIHDSEHANDGIRLRRAVLRSGRGGHLPASTRLATVMYLRPASWAWATASPSEEALRTLASLTSIGRLIPASTSTLGSRITEIHRVDGVPPNVSRRIATPPTVSTCVTGSIVRC